MPAEQPGFLSSLGVSPVDEGDLVQAQRDSLLTKRQQTLRNQGRSGGQALASLVGAGASAVRDRSFKGFGSNVSQNFQRVTDQDTAQASGITLDQLRGRREIRQLTTETPSDGTFESRIDLARKVADIANRHGDSDVLGNALRRITDLRTEQTEFQKLQAVTAGTEAEAELEGTVDGFLDGKPVTGTLAQEDGVHGLMVSDSQGKARFVPWGENLFRDRGKPGEPVERRLSRVLGKKEIGEVRGVIQGQAEVLRKYDGVMSTLIDAANAGNVQEIIGNAGNTLAFLDNTIRSIRGVLGAFVPGDTFAKDSDLLTKFRGRANNPNDALWDQIQLPEWARGDAAQAQNYRARLMEMAYLSARAAEPSNRGLSDNDIKNALIRIGGATANPAVLMRRSVEVLADGAASIDDRLKSYYGAFPADDASNVSEITPDQIDAFFGGQLLQEYRGRVDELYGKFGVSIGTDGRATFANPIDTDVQPLTGQIQQQTTEQVIADDEFNAILDSILTPDLRE